MAETIGRAYIKILADGSGFPESVKDEVRAAEPALKKEARRQGDAYADEFGKRVSQKDIGKNIRESLERSMARTDIARAYFGSRDWDRFLGRLKKEAGQAGVLAGHELEVEFRHNIEGLADAVGDMGPRFDRAAQRLADSTSVATHEFEGLTRTIRETVSELDDLVESEDDANESHRETGRTLAGLHDWLVRTSKSFDELGDSVGKAFGKGKRNNFLNFFGGLMGGITRIPGLLAGAGGKMIDFAEGIEDAFKDAPNAFRGFLAAAGQIAPAVGSAVVGFVLLVSALGTVTSAFLLAAGAAAALVSTMAFGLVGAIAPLVGLLGPLGLAVGGVALAFIGMSDAAKQSVKEAFEPLKDELKALGDAARPGILDGITAAAENLEGPMKRLEPLFKVVGDSVGVFIDKMTKMSFGPGFDKFVDVMTATLPDTMESLGVIFGRTFDGLAGLFATLQPVTDTFLNALERISGAFADWSISPQAGTFFDHAADSASALLDFLSPVWDLTQEILGAGRETGDSLFKSMGDTIQGWVDALKANPDILKDFFDDAKRMGEAIGDVVVEVGHLIDALDTPLHREWAIQFIETIGDLIGLIGDLVGAFGELPGALQAVVLGAGVGLTAFSKLSGGALSLVGNLRNAETRMGTLAGAAKMAGGAAGIGLFIDGLGRGETALGTFEQIAGGAAAGFAVGGPWGAAIGAAAGGFVALVNSAKSAGDAVKAAGDGASDSIGDWDSLAESLNQTSGAYTEMTRKAVFEQIMKEGADGAASMATQFDKLGVSTRTVIDAMLGQPKAVTQVQDALNALDSQIATNKATLDEYNISLADMAAEPTTHAAEIQDLEKRRDALEANIAEQENLRQSVEAGWSALGKHSEAVRKEAGAVLDWRNKLRGFPEKIITQFEAGNIPHTMNGVKSLLQQYKGIQSVKKVRTLFEALGIEKTDKQIRRIIDKAKDWGKQNPKAKIGADTQNFEERLAKIKGQMNQLPRTPAKGKFDADTSKFDNKNRDVKNKINETGKLNPKIKVDAETAAASQNLTGVKTQVDNLPTSKTITIHVNTIGKVPKTASGGIFAGAQTRLIGEAGPEAVVPLNRSLAQVDPAVRELSAIAQGMRYGMQQRPVAQKTIDVGGIQIITPTQDPGAVAQEMVNRLVAVGY